MGISIALAIVMMSAGHFADCHAVACPSLVIGVDTSKANGLDGPILGEAVGQTFLAADTLISSLTVWRIAAEDTNYTGLYLYITGTDSAGAPAPNSILLQGPIAYNFYGDGIHPIPIRFDFDPPVALPHPGEYYFALQAYPCNGFFNLIGSSADPYKDGISWLNGRTPDCHLRNYPNEYLNNDWIFTIEFCGPSTPAVPTTWGNVKSRYH